MIGVSISRSERVQIAMVGKYIKLSYELRRSLVYVLFNNFTLSSTYIFQFSSVNTYIFLLLLKSEMEETCFRVMQKHCAIIARCIFVLK